MKKILFYILILITILYTSCLKKEPTYPSAPVIAYKDFIRYGKNPSNPDSVELVVSFKDNEGDIGLAQADTQGFFKVGNIFMDYLYWDTVGPGPDHWSYYDMTLADSIPFDTFKIAYRVPPVLRSGDLAQPMKGLIYVKQKSPFKEPSHNKIMYVVYLYDKAHHRSDTIHTPAFLF